MAESGEQGREEEEVAEISGGSGWSVSTTRMLISYYKEIPILWDKRLRENENKTKTKKAMAPLTARFEKANPPRSAQALKAKWHSLRSSVLRYLKKQKEEEDIEIKWPFCNSTQSYSEQHTGTPTIVRSFELRILFLVYFWFT